MAHVFGVDRFTISAFSKYSKVGVTTFAPTLWKLVRSTPSGGLADLYNAPALRPSRVFSRDLFQTIKSSASCAGLRS